MTTLAEQTWRAVPMRGGSGTISHSWIAVEIALAHATLEGVDQ